MKKRVWIVSTVALALIFAAILWKLAARRPVVVAVFPPESPTLIMGSYRSQTRTLLSPDGRKIWLAANWSQGIPSFPLGGAAIWDVVERRKICDTPNYLYAAWSNDSQTLALAPDSDVEAHSRTRNALQVRLVNAQNGTIQKLRDTIYRAGNSSDWGNYSLAFSPDDREVRFLSLAQLRRFNLKTKRVAVSNLHRRSVDGSESGQFAPNGDLLLTSSRGGSQWQISPDGQLKRRAFKLPKCGSFRFSRDGKWAVGWFFDASVGVFQTSNWRQAWRISSPYKQQTFVEFSSDSREIYVLENDQPMARFDVQSGRKIGSSAPIFNAIASPDGRYFYETRDGKIWRWPNPA